MTDRPPLVSVIIPVHNKEEFVAQTIASVEAQTHPAVEIIVVDDGSTDGSLDAIHRSASDDTTIVESENQGVSGARNLGATRSDPSSSYLWFLDSDDVLEPDAIATYAAYMERHPDVGVVYAPSTAIGVDSSIIPTDDEQHRWDRTTFGRRHIPESDPETPLEAIIADFRILPSVAMLRRDVYERTDGWNSELCRPARDFQAEDRDLGFQMAMLAPVHWLPEPKVRYRTAPAPHQSHAYTGIRVVEWKWWNSPDLTRGDRRRVRAAIRFSARVYAFDRAGDVAAAIKGGDVGATGASMAEFARSLVRYAMVPLRMRGGSKYGHSDLRAADG